MNIRFVSSLDAEDEIRFATAMLAGVAKFLDELPMAYTIRLETAAGKVIEHHHAAEVSGIDGKEFWKSPASAEKSASNGSLGGHPKTGHRSTLQNRPPRA